MALLKDLLVRGESVLIGNATAGTIYADHFVMNGSTNQYVLLGDGTHYPLSSISSTSHTHLVTINGATKSIGATSVDLGNYLPIAGGTMTGSIKRFYNTDTSDPMIAMTSSSDYDSWLWRINYSTSGATTATSGVYGFGLKYLGSGSGNNNSLALYADNQTGTQIKAFEMKQSGDVFAYAPIHWTNSTSLPQNTSPQYFLTVDEFTSGGQTKWTSKASLASAIGLGNYLPLSGGTMTGVLTLLGNQYTDTNATGALNANNSDIYNVNSIKFADDAANAAEGLQWYRDASHVDTFWVHSGEMYFTPNRAWGSAGTSYRIWHEGNDGSSSGLDADKLDGLDSTAFVKRQDSTRFYPHIGSSYGKQWYKVTLPNNGHYRDSVPWYMVAMEINLSAAYAEGAHGKIFLSFYFQKAAGQDGAYSAGDVKAIAIGKRLKYNSISIKYDLANPAIFYIHANNNNYNSISISNLSANDTAPSFDYRNTTIEGVDSCPSSADKVVPITILDTTTGGETTTYSDFILSASGDSPGLIFNRTGGNEVDWKAYVSNGDFFFSTATDASTWSTKLKIANSTGDIYVGSNKVLHAGTTYVTGGVGTINNTTITKVENATNTDKTKTVTSSSANNHYLTFVDSDNSSATAESIYTTSKLYVKPSTGDLYSSGHVFVNNTTASLCSDGASKIWLSNSSGSPLVVDGTVIRRSTSLSTAQLGNDTYPWAKSYTTTWCTANYEIREVSSRMAFGSHAQTTAKGINIGDLLVSNAWADSTKVPTNGIYSKGIVKSGASIEATTYMRATDGNTYVGSASGTQCHMKYDTSLECLKFIFD